jgi:metal-sulfur cluster biosynthetic enzyme
MHNQDSGTVKQAKKAQVVAALSTVLDPELGLDIVELGLVYDIDIKDDDVRVVMTMTTPACPLNSYFSKAIERAIRRRLPEVLQCEIEIVWQPPWDAAMMAQEAKRQMGWK